MLSLNMSAHTQILRNRDGQRYKEHAGHSGWIQPVKTGTADETQESICSLFLIRP